MTQRHDTTLVTIGEAVESLQKTHPDVSHSSLRFLQREGLIDPPRTKGGHRKYRPGDLERIRTIKNWQAQRLSLAEIRDRLTRLDTHSTPDDICRQFLEHALEGKFREATQLVLQAHDFGLSLTVLFQEVLTPALVEVGDLWANGDISVGQEHEVSEFCRDVIAELSLRHGGTPLSSPQKTILAACVENEHHELGLRMIAALLRDRGAKVHFLGSDTPLQSLLQAVQMRQPDVVVLSSTMAENRPAAIEAMDALQNAGLRGTDTWVLVGGQDAKAWGEHRPAGAMLLTSGDLGTVVEVIMTGNYTS